MYSRHLSNTTSYFGFEGLTVYQSDVNLLSPGRWLNDTIISFMMLYFSKLYPETDISFIQPSALMLIRFGDEKDTRSVIEGSKIDTANLVIFAVSDVTHTEIDKAEAGSHWSTLVFHRPSLTFFHLDSLFMHNNQAAFDIASKLTTEMSLEDTTFVELNCDQQTNGNDCGIFSIVFMQRAMQAFRENPINFEAKLEELALAKVLPIKIRSFIWDSIEEAVSKIEVESGVRIRIKPPC
ncbi:hypothetical protein P9112_013059 [Eukaryota sp. TZLM1-RC]